MITAGVDIDPARYGEERAPQVREIAPARDAFETAILEDALRRDGPVLAICRGHQLFNVAAGGSLLQHLEEREPHRARRGEATPSIRAGTTWSWPRGAASPPPSARGGCTSTRGTTRP